ncbi:MAG: hypothetical protein KDI79_22335, partial [Anaerolineae bacterium]|nr:hypothetical protein [Anaerolineae bacterium]
RHKIAFLGRKGLFAALKGVIFSRNGRRPRCGCIFAADHAFQPAVAAFTAAMSVFCVRTRQNFS